MNTHPPVDLMCFRHQNTLARKELGPTVKSREGKLLPGSLYIVSLPWLYRYGLIPLGEVIESSKYRLSKLRMVLLH